MNKTAYTLIALLAVLVVAQGFWIWHSSPAPTTASLVVDATNAGVDDEAGRGRRRAAVPDPESLGDHQYGQQRYQRVRGFIHR